MERCFQRVYRERWNDNVQRVDRELTEIGDRKMDRDNGIDGRGPSPLKFDDKSSHDLPVWMEPDMVSQQKKQTKEVNYTGVVQCANRDGKH